MAKRARREREQPRWVAPAIPPWVPTVLFVGLTLLVFRSFVFSNRMLYGGDTLALGYVARAFYAHALTQLHIFPRWAPDILGGTPFLEALSGGDSLYPPSVLLLLLTASYRALGWKLVVHIAAAGFFMFGWLRTTGRSRSASLLGGTAYMLAPYLVSLVHPGHDGKIFVTTLTPLLFWAVERWFTRPRLPAFTAVAFVVALVIFTTHFQLAYFLFGAVGLYAIFRTVQTWRAGTADEHPAGARTRVASMRFALFLVASLAGVGVAAVQFVPAVQYVTQYSRRVQTTRQAAGETGVAWSSSWSLHPEEAMSLLIPEFAGSDAGGSAWAENTYWGRNPFKDNHEGAGVVVLLLAAVGIAGSRRRARSWFFVGLGGIAFLFALGTHTPVWRIFYEVVPGIRLFRAPSQAMFLFAFGAATLGALGLDTILDLGAADQSRRKVLMRTLWIGVGVMGALALLASSGALTSFWTSVVYRNATAANLGRLAQLQPFIVRGAWITFLLIAAAAGLVWTLDAGYLTPAVVVGGLVVLVAVDELRVDSTFVQVIDFQEWSAPDPNIQAILRNEQGSDEPYRLLDFQQQGQDVKPALQGIELAAGHHPNDLSRYRELIGMVGSGLPQNLFDGDIRRLLNVKYILWPDYEFGRSISGPTLSRTTLRDGTPYATVLQENGLPRARLVGAATVKSDGEDVQYMLSDAFDPEREVVLPEAPPIQLDGEPAAGTVRWLERTPNELRLSVATERPALLVIADNWFPAWHAAVDGAEAPVLRAYHTLRAVPVPEGEHTVAMVYRSAVVARSLWASLILLFGLGSATLVRLWMDRRAGRPS